jgi:hypothetical protein
MHVGTAWADSGPWFELCKGATSARFEAECFHCMIATYILHRHTLKPSGSSTNHQSGVSRLQNTI